MVALSQGKINALKGAFVDKLHQPYRADLIPGMYDVFEIAQKNGALGTTIVVQSYTHCIYCRKC